MYLLKIAVSVLLICSNTIAEAQDSHPTISVLLDSANIFLYIHPQKGLPLVEKVLASSNKNELLYVHAMLLKGTLLREERQLKESEMILQEAMVLAKKWDEPSLLLACNRELGLVQRLKGDKNLAKTFLQTALTISIELELDIETIDIQIKLADILVSESNYVLVDSLFKEIKKPIDQFSDKKIAADYLFTKAYYYTIKHQYDSALWNYQLAFEKYKTQGYLVKSADVLRNMAMLHKNRGMFDRALVSLFDAAEIYRKIGVQIKQADTYNTLAELYRYTHREIEALRYYEKAKTIYLSTNNQLHQGTIQLNLGNLYFRSLNQKDKALAAFQKAVNIYRSEKADRRLGLALQNLGELQIQMQDFKGASQSLKEAKKLREQLADPQGLLRSYIGLGELYSFTKAYTQASNNLTQAQDLLNRTSDFNTLAYYYQVRAELAIQTGQADSATYFLQQFGAMKDSLARKEQLTQIAQMEVAYETSEKERALRESEIREEAMQETLIQKDRAIIGFSVAGVLLLTVVGLLFHNINKSKAFNRELAAKNTQLEESNTHIKYLMGELNHRVKNNMASLSSMLAVQLHYIEDTTAREAVIESRNRVQAMTLLHKSLYQDEHNPTKINLKEFIPNLLDHLEASYGIKRDTVKRKMHIKVPLLDTDIGIQLAMMINEILNNAIKYAFCDHPNPQIDIDIYKKQDQLRVAIKDNGPGLPKNLDLKKTNSFGMTMIDRFTRQHRGSYNIVSDNGITFELNIPLKEEKMAQATI